MAVAPLFKDLNDGAKENTHLFRAEFLRRAVASGWDSGARDIVNIPSGHDPMEQKNFIHQNQSLQKAEVEAWAQANIINQTTRKVQNNFNAV